MYKIAWHYIAIKLQTRSIVLPYVLCCIVKTVSLPFSGRRHTVPLTFIFPPPPPVPVTQTGATGSAKATNVQVQKHFRHFYAVFYSFIYTVLSHEHLNRFYQAAVDGITFFLSFFEPYDCFL